MASGFRMDIRIAALVIVVFTLIGVQLGYLPVDATLDTTTAVIMIVILAVMSIVQLVTVRLIVLPSLFENPQALPWEQVVNSSTTIGYSFCISIVIYGVVSAVFTSQGLIALPFGALALLAAIGMSSYLNEMSQKRN